MKLSDTKHPAGQTLGKIPRKITRFVRGVATLARRGLPRTLVFVRGGIGDDLLCTCVLHELRQRGERGLWMMSDRPELFQDNPDTDGVLPEDTWILRFLQRRGARLIHPSYAPILSEEGRQSPPAEHIISAMCRQAGVSGTITLKPRLFLGEEERRQGRRAPRQIAIQSTGLSARVPMREKEWYPERFQAVVSALQSDFDFIQLGSRDDPPLSGALDLRGKTSLRQAAAILSQSLVFIGQVGFLMHLARAVDCRSVIVYGGRELPSQSGYPCNENLYTPLDCAPCWRINSCPHDRECMRRIRVDDVLETVRRQVQRYGAPMSLERDVL